MRDGKKAETFDTCERIIKSSSRRQTAHILWWLKASQVLSSFDSHIVVPSLWLLSLEERKKKVNYTSFFLSLRAELAGGCFVRSGMFHPHTLELFSSYDVHRKFV